MRRGRGDQGNAVVEVALLAPVLLVPLVWAAIAIAMAVSAQGAVISAARQSARAYVLSPNPVLGGQAARRVASAVVARDGRNLARPVVTIACVPVQCLAANGRVDVTVTTSVTLGFLPLPFTKTPTITLSATQSALVDPFRG